jgi:peptidoglycan/LPS O-acetylase OafA/YrhL
MTTLTLDGTANIATSARTHSHLRALDTLRGLSALGVFVGHFVRQFYPQHLGEPWAIVLDRLGVIGVSVFFVLSGFLIHSAGMKELKRAGQMDWWAYARRRFLRIYPAYGVALLVYALVAAQLPSNNTSPASVLGVVSHLLLLSNFVPGEMHSINGVLWSVVVECHFYLLYPVWLGLSQRWGAAMAFLVVLLAGVGFFGVATVLTHAGEARVLLQQAAPAVFWKWALGAVLAEMLLKGRFAPLRKALSHGWLLVPVVVALYVGSFVHGGALELTFQRFVLPVVCAALVGLFVFSPISRMGSALGEWLGEVSYSVYLWHPLAIALVLAKGLDGAWATALAALVLTLLFAALSHRCLELPFMQMAHRRPAPSGA